MSTLPPNNATNPQPVKSTSGLGIAALVLGILAILSSWIPIINNLAGLLALVGVILGAIAIYKTRPSGKSTGRGIAIAGTILSAVALIIVIATQIFYVKALTQASDELEKQTGTTTASAPAETKTKTDTAQDSKAADKPAANAVLIGEKYLVENLEAKAGAKDYDGKPAVVVSYDLTNKSDKNTSPLAAVVVKVFQNKVTLETDFIEDGVAGYKASDEMKEIQPGGKLHVTHAFRMQDTDNPLTVEVSGFLTMDGKKLVKEFPAK